MNERTTPFDLDLARWDALDEPSARDVVRAIEARLPRARFLRFEDHGRRVAVFDVGGIEMVLIPGARARLGFDRELLDESAASAWSRSFEHEGHAAQRVLGGPDVGRPPPEDMIAYLRDVSSPPREVTIPPFLLERSSDRDVARDQHEDPHVAMAKAVVAEGFRLPSADEWEYASTGGRRTSFRWGNQWPVDSDVWDGGPFEGHRGPNAFGLSYRVDPYHTEIVDDPWELRGGDGGCLVCGGSGPIGWVTFTHAFRYRLKADDDREIWLEHAHVRRALSITPREGEGAVRPYVPKTVYDDVDLALGTLTRILDSGEGLDTLPDLARVAAAFPDDARIHVAVAHGHRKLGQLEHAEAAARRALSLSESVGPYTTLAAVLHGRGDLEGALRAYEAAIAIDPAQVGTYTSAGDMLKEAGRFAEAARWFERALEQDARAGYARIMRSYTLFRATGDAEHAQAIVEIARGPAKGVAWIEAIADEVAPGWRGTPS